MHMSAGAHPGLQLLEVQAYKLLRFISDWILNFQVLQGIIDWSFNYKYQNNESGIPVAGPDR